MMRRKARRREVNWMEMCGQRERRLTCQREHRTVINTLTLLPRLTLTELCQLHCIIISYRLNETTQSYSLPPSVNEITLFVLFYVRFNALHGKIYWFCDSAHVNRYRLTTFCIVSFYLYHHCYKLKPRENNANCCVTTVSLIASHGTVENKIQDISEVTNHQL